MAGDVRPMTDSVPVGWRAFDWRLGPIWTVAVGAPGAAAGERPPFIVSALIDTGATDCFAPPGLFQRLGAQPTGDTQTVANHDAVVQHRDIFRIDLSVPLTDGQNAIVLRNFPVVSDGWIGEETPARPYQLVLGCNVFRHCRFTVDGQFFRLEPAGGAAQLRTRVYGKGHGETVPCDVVAGETILPIANAVMFNPAGGRAIAATTSLGAQSQVLTYAGVQLGGGGSLVGPGQSPPVALAASVVSGAGLGVGVYAYAYTDVTGAGESLPSPLATITTGPVAAPSSAPTATVASGPGVDSGSHDYELTFIDAGGETTPSPISNSVTTSNYTITAPPSAPTVANNGTFPASGWLIGDSLFATYTYIGGAGQTTAGGNSSTITAASFDGTHADELAITVAASSDPNVAFIRVYINVNGSWRGYTDVTNANWTPLLPDVQFSGSPPGANTAIVYSNQVSLTNLPIGGGATTGRKIYRRQGGAGTFKLAVTIANNTATTATDTTPNASLGAAAPSSNTAIEQRVSLSAIALGPATTTQRRVYRTTVNGSQLKLLTTIGDNTTTVFADSTADASLGANAPTGDTSGFTLAAGQVNPGSTSLLTAGAGPFAAIGGWVILAGGQIVRYTGISGNTLTGVPASGSGAITTTVLYGSQVLPSPALTGLNQNNGLRLAIANGSKVNLWVQRDDLAAQAALAALEGGDGIREYMITDERMAEATIAAACDADLAIFSRPIVSVSYQTRDPKTRAGKTVHIDTTGIDPTNGIVGDFVIQSVDITFDGPGLMPRYSVQASSTNFTLAELLRRVVLS